MDFFQTFLRRDLGVEIGQVLVYDGGNDTFASETKQEMP